MISLLDHPGINPSNDDHVISLLDHLGINPMWNHPRMVPRVYLGIGVLGMNLRHILGPSQGGMALLPS